METSSARRLVAVTGPAPDSCRTAITARLRGDGWELCPLDTPGLHAVVQLELEPRAVGELAFADTDEDRWDALAEEPARRTLAVLQTVYRNRGAEGTVVVLVQPASALEGAAGLVAATTGWEAQRQLAKSVARRWGADGIRVNVVGVAPDLLGSPPPDAMRTDRALASAAGADELAATVALLLLPEAAALTGATVAIDGGALMQP